MSSLIFKRDVENPYFRKHDSQVHCQSPKLDHLLTKTFTTSPSNHTAPYFNLPQDSGKPILSMQHKASLPTLFEEYSLPDVANKPKGRVDVIPISTLYTEGNQPRAKSTSVPQLYWKYFDGPPVSSTHRPTEPSKFLISPKTSARPRTNLSMFKEKDPFEHDKLVGYLEFLEKTEKPYLKDKLSLKPKKSTSCSVRHVSIKEEPPARQSPVMKTEESMQSAPKKSVHTRVSMKVLEPVDGGYTKRTSSSNTAHVPKFSRGNTIDLNLGLKDKGAEGFNSYKSKGMMSRVKTSKEFKSYRNNHEAFFKTLAQNLNELYSIFANEKKVHEVIGKLCEENLKIMQLVSSKTHKIMNYDVLKLEQRFAMVEFMTEHISIPEKLEKMRQGVILLEGSLLNDITNFNQNVEEYVIMKKRNQLKQMEDGLIQTENNLQKIILKKTKDLKVKNMVKEYNEAKMIVDDRPKVGMYFLTVDDPVTVVEQHQKTHGDLKYVKQKNIEHARGLKEVFSSWRKYLDE